MPLTTHYFGYRKWKDGKPTDVQIEVIVKSDVSRAEALRIAQAEITALESGHAKVVDREGLNQCIAGVERRINRRLLASYQYMGCN